MQKSELSLHRAQRGGCVGFNALLFFIFLWKKRVALCDVMELKWNSFLQQNSAFQHKVISIVLLRDWCRNEMVCASAWVKGYFRGEEKNRLWEASVKQGWNFFAIYLEEKNENLIDISKGGRNTKYKES